MPDPRYHVALTIPQWDSVQAAIDTAAGQATDAGDSVSVGMWADLHNAISEQLP